MVIISRNAGCSRMYVATCHTIQALHDFVCGNATYYVYARPSEQIFCQTNSNVEGFHNLLNKSLPYHHPIIYIFIQTIGKLNSQRDQSWHSIEYEPFNLYGKKYTETQSMRYQVNPREKTRLDFLDVVGYLLKLAQIDIFPVTLY